MTSPRLNSVLFVAIAASLALTACNRDDTSYNDDAAMTPPVASEAATTPEPMPPAAEPVAMVTVTTIDLGNAVGEDMRVTAPLATFATDDTIHASIATSGNGGTVSTRWTFQDGQVVHSEDKTVAAGDQVTDFMISNPEPWPTGSYTLDVMVDGEVVQTREFTVE